MCGGASGRASAQTLSLEIGEVTKEMLWNAYPKALVHQPGTFSGKLEPHQQPEYTVRHVLGSPMNTGSTPKEAAESWLGEWGEVFGVLDITLKPEWEMPLPAREDWKIVKTALRYTQTMGNLPVAGSDIRIVTARDKTVKPGTPGSEKVISVEALVLPAPALGLEPTQSKQQILAAAAKLRPQYTSWTEPTLLVSPKVPGHAAYGSHLAYITTGGSPEHEAEFLLIDAHTGELIRSGPANPSCGFGHEHDDRGAHDDLALSDGAHGVVPVALDSVNEDSKTERTRSSSRTTSGNVRLGWAGGGRSGIFATPQPISGTVYAWRTPDWWSDTRFITSPSACLRNPVLYEQEEVRVELWNTAGTTLYDTEYTDSDGEYSLVPPSPGNYLVRATLGGQNWDVVYFADQVLGCATTPPSEPDPVDQELASVASGTTTADFYFGGTSSTYSSLAQPIADTNVHEAVRICMSYWRSVVPEGSPLNDEFMVWTNWDAANATFLRQGGPFPLGASGTWPCDDVIRFGIGNSVSTVHFGDPTIVAHEFGHLVAFRLGIVGYHPPPNHGMAVYPAFSEGYSDATTGTLLLDASGPIAPTIIGPDQVGDMCGGHRREPLVYDPAYPVCFTNTTTFFYDNGMLLAALWMDMRSGLGFGTTRVLFSSWTPIATPPGIEVTCSGCPSLCVPDEGAGANTLYEVLIADDDDEDLGNGTPNDALICATFASRRISLEVDIDICSESAFYGPPLLADFDQSGAVDLNDALVFMLYVSSADRYADIDHDGKVTARDIGQFSRAFRDAIGDQP